MVFERDLFEPGRTRGAGFMAAQADLFGGFDHFAVRILEVVLADHATRNLVGPHHYEEYLLPIHQEITAQVGGPIILHVCGNCSDRLELFARTGVDAYHFEGAVDSKEAVKRVGDRISLVGNINNARTLLQGTPEDVYQQARYAIAAGVNIIGPECAIPLSTPLENLRAIVEAARAGY
jgi:MtaA/CmuA family methyltransferase